MKYAVVLGLAMAAALLGGLVFSGGAANASDEIRLRAFLSEPGVDPFGLNVADFRQRPDRKSFDVDVHNVAQDGTGTVSVIATGVVILDNEPIMIVLGIGHLEMDSRLGHTVPVMGDGDTVEVRNAVGALIGTGTLDPK